MSLPAALAVTFVYRAWGAGCFGRCAVPPRSSYVVCWRFKGERVQAQFAVLDVKSGFQIALRCAPARTFPTLRQP